MSIWKITGMFMFCALFLWSADPLQARETSASEPSEVHDLLAQARSFEQNGDSSRALSLLRQYVLENPAAEQTPEAYARLSRLLLREGRVEQARLYAARIPSTQRPQDLTLLLAREYATRKEPARTKQMLESLDPQTLSNVQHLEYTQIRALLALQRGELMQVLVHCNRILQSGDADVQMLAATCEIAFKALDQMDVSTREESAFMFAATPVEDLLLLHKLEKRKPAQAETGSTLYRRGEDLVRSDAPAWVRKRALAWLDQVKGTSWRQHAIGVVLPLSGRYAPFGRMVKQGIELALAQQGNTRIRLIVRDSQADVARTEEVMRDLLEEQRVMAVLGPMMGETATRAAEIAQEHRMPIILLSHWEGLPQLGSYVFRHSLTARQQARALVDYAVHILGLQTFALLQPENKLGDDFTRHFRTALEQQGGEVIYHRSYPPGSTDFRAALDPMAPEEIEESKEQTPGTETAEGIESESGAQEEEPQLEYDAIFIPDFSDTIALLAPQLAFSDIEGAQLLGINGWNSPDLLKRAGRYVRGAVFSDGFYPESSDIFVQNFVTRYRQRYAEMPTILAAQSYDAANFLMQILQNPEVTRPRQVRARMEEIDYTGAVSGLRGFNPEGEALRDIVLFRFGRKQIERIDPAALQPVAPEDFAPRAED